MKCRIEGRINEMKWIAIFSISLMFLWSFPLVLRLVLAIPCIIFLQAFVEKSSYCLFFKRFLYAGIVSTGIVLFMEMI